MVLNSKSEYNRCIVPRIGVQYGDMQPEAEAADNTKQEKEKCSKRKKVDKSQTPKLPVLNPPDKRRRVKGSYERVFKPSVTDISCVNIANVVRAEHLSPDDHGGGQLDVGHIDTGQQQGVGDQGAPANNIHPPHHGPQPTKRPRTTSNSRGLITSFYDIKP